MGDNTTTLAMITVGGLMTLLAISVSISTVMNFGGDMIFDDTDEIINLGLFLEEQCEDAAEGGFTITREHEINLRSGDAEISQDGDTLEVEHDDGTSREYECEVDVQMDLGLGEENTKIPSGGHSIYVETVEENGEHNLRVYSN